eukprot:577652-Pelagomonas_calceolata.AAC.2
MCAIATTSSSGCSFLFGVNKAKGAHYDAMRAFMSRGMDRQTPDGRPLMAGASVPSVSTSVKCEYQEKN